MEEYEVNENNENIKNGSYKYYSENGDLIVEGAYKNNKKNRHLDNIQLRNYFFCWWIQRRLAQDKMDILLRN